MKYEVLLYPDGTTVRFKSLDQPGVETVNAEELQKRLATEGIGEELKPSLSAVRGIVARLLERPDLPADVKHTLVLIDQSSKHALIANHVEAGRNVVESDYRRQILSMQLMLAGDVPIGKGGIRVNDGLFQNVVIRTIETGHADFAAAADDERAAIAEQVAKQIFLLVGRIPSVALVSEALEATGLRGRPPGSRNGAPPIRGKDEVYNELLREIGLQSTSPEALKKQRKRGNKRGDI